MPVDDLTKHALVTGFTGSGKTVTVLRILHQVWASFSIPFLVLESAKQEYRGFAGVAAFNKDLRIYTLGNELGVPFRFNPFELLPGVRVEAHVGRLQVCFEGAIPPAGPSSSVIAEALVRVYDRSGWAITDACPESSFERTFPTMSDFLDTVKDVIESRKYSGEVKSNVTAAIIGRLSPLIIGSKGRMLDCRRSNPVPEELFGCPTVLEMNDLNSDDKALIVMFVLTLLREYRERQFLRESNAAGQLRHVTVVEEAHNVLSDVKSAGTGEGAGADTKFKAVEAFCSLLTEVRALGEGLIIADQSPEKLAADAMRNTNLQIAHQLRDGHDREAIANAMIMTEQQRDFVGKLKPGYAALFRTGLERATFVMISPYYPLTSDDENEGQLLGVGFNRKMQEQAVIDFMQGKTTVSRLLSLPFDGCEFCKNKCKERDKVFPLLFRPATAYASAWFAEFEAPGPHSVSAKVLWDKLASTLTKIYVSRYGAIPDGNAAWCLFLHLYAVRYGTKPGSKAALTEAMHTSCVRRFE